MSTLQRIALVLVGTLAPATVAFAQQQGGQSYRHHMWDGGPWMFLGPLMMIFFIAITIVVIVLLLRWLGVVGHTGPQQAQPAGRGPLDILKERYARGEIDKEEYEERRRVLGEQ